MFIVVLADTCEYKRVFHHIISECNDFYSIEEEDRGSYLPGWKGIPLVPQNVSVPPVPTPSKAPTPKAKGPWVYQSGDDLKTFPYWGYKATYSAGGMYYKYLALVVVSMKKARRNTGKR